jgi:hypothetical protein
LLVYQPAIDPQPEKPIIVLDDSGATEPVPEDLAAHLP